MVKKWQTGGGRGHGGIGHGNGFRGIRFGGNGGDSYYGGYPLYIYNDYEYPYYTYYRQQPVSLYQIVT
jgi:hypothetical protein